MSARQLLEVLGVYAFRRARFGRQEHTRRPIIFTGVSVGWFAFGRFKLDTEWQPEPRPPIDFDEMLAEVDPKEGTT